MGKASTATDKEMREAVEKLVRLKPPKGGQPERESELPKEDPAPQGQPTIREIADELEKLLNVYTNSSEFEDKIKQVLADMQGSKGTSTKESDPQVSIQQPEMVEYPDGTKSWYLNDQRHREDGPAIERPDGLKFWYLNGKLHRENGPAVEYPDGRKEWYLNDQRHRENGPAIEWSDGYKEWRLNGQPHREDGPAIEYPNGRKEWFLNGVELSEEEHAEQAKSKPEPEWNDRFEDAWQKQVNESDVYDITVIDEMYDNGLYKAVANVHTLTTAGIEARIKWLGGMWSDADPRKKPLPDGSICKRRVSMLKECVGDIYNYAELALLSWSDLPDDVQISINHYYDQKEIQKKHRFW